MILNATACEIDLFALNLARNHHRRLEMHNLKKGMIFLSFTLSTLLFLSDIAVANSIKSLEKELLQEVIVTKRGWTGKVKRAGTVFVVNREGIPISTPKAVPRPVMITLEGVDESALSDTDRNRRELRVGDRLHVYRLQLGEQQIELMMGTEVMNDQLSMGQTIESHLQTNLIIPLDKPTEENSVQEILDTIAIALVREDAVTQLPGLQAAMIEIKGTKIPFSPGAVAAIEAKSEREPDENGLAIDANHQGNVSRRRGQAVASNNWSEDSAREISCSAAEWEGTVTNLADLFECDSIKAIQNMSGGRTILFEVGDLVFSNSKFRSKMRVSPTWRSVRWKQIEAIKNGMDQFYEAKTFNQKSVRYTINCVFSPDAIDGAKVGDKISIEARLTDFQDKNMVLECG